MTTDQATERAQQLLKIAAKYIRKYKDDGIIVYDDAECDGACLADDCEFAAENLEVFEE